VSSTSSVVITPRALLRHWQGHRSLTRRVIDAFPEDKLFSYSVGGMRPFAELAFEMIHLADSGIQGMAKGDWSAPRPSTKSKAELLAIWDRTTETIERLWPELPEDIFQKKSKAFGQWEGTGQSHFFYWIDNEIHHRGQGYVYLRALGIEPPAFYDRS
jgi:uncharacterized damage-inducible protein DinB